MRANRLKSHRREKVRRDNAAVPYRCTIGFSGSRIAEGLTEWTWGDRTGYGWSEYLDHAD